MTTVRLSAATLGRRLHVEDVSRRSGPAYRVLAGAITAALLDGRLAAGDGLPSEREFALAQGVSRTTVAAAYASLRQQGWLSSRRGSGSVLRVPDADGQRVEAGLGRLGRLARSSGLASPADAGSLFGYPAPTGDAVIDLSVACPPAAGEPFRRAVSAAVARLTEFTDADGYSPLGLPVLREAIAARYTGMGAPTRVEQILVTNGAQHAVTLCLAELSAPGDRVLLENPTYPVALDAVRAGRRVPHVVGLLHRTDGGNPWDVDLLAGALRQIRPRLAYLIPDFQNPTGGLMPLADRTALVAAARAVGTILLIDESFRDVPLDDVELPLPLAAVAGDGPVISLGSVSKSFWGGLRIGWIRAAPRVVQRLGARRALFDMAGPVLDQLIVAELLADPEPAYAVQRNRLRAGRTALLEALATQLPDWQPTRPGGRACLWARLPGPFATELAAAAGAVGIRVVPGPRFGPDGTMPSFLRLPFTLPPAQLTEAVRRLSLVTPAASAAVDPAATGWLA